MRIVLRIGTVPLMCACMWLGSVPICVRPGTVPACTMTEGLSPVCPVYSQRDCPRYVRPRYVHHIYRTAGIVQRTRRCERIIDKALQPAGRRRFLFPGIRCATISVPSWDSDTLLGTVPRPTPSKSCGGVSPLSAFLNNRGQSSTGTRILSMRLDGAALLTIF